MGKKKKARGDWSWDTKSEVAKEVENLRNDIKRKVKEQQERDK